MFEFLDEELSGGREESFRAHLEACTACARELRLLSLPRRLGKALPVFEPSPFFYQKLRAQLDGAAEAQPVTVWQILLALSRQVVPALASVTLVLVGVFIYTQLRAPQVDFQAYDSIFLTGERPQSLVIAAQGDVTDESVLRAIVEKDSPDPDPGEPAPKK
jgi:anti-sigma factor RsiW